MSLLPFNQSYAMLNPYGFSPNGDVDLQNPPGQASPMLDGLFGGYGGLLSPDDKQTAINRGLLGLGASLLQSSGPSPVPVSLGQAVGRGIPQAFGMSDAYANRQASNNLVQQKIAAAKIGRGEYYKDIYDDKGNLWLLDTRRGSLHRPSVQSENGINPLTGAKFSIPLTQQLAGASARGNVQGGGKITEVEKKGEGRSNLTSLANEMFRQYSELDKSGAIVNTENSAIENIGASIRSSGVGQALGRVTGTSEQAVRDNINQMRPTLLNYIRQASNQGARGLDSEKELEFYLQAATDTQRNIQTNKAALKVLVDAYGIGKDIDSRYFSGTTEMEARRLRNEYESLIGNDSNKQPGIPQGWSVRKK